MQAGNDRNPQKTPEMRELPDQEGRKHRHSNRSQAGGLAHFSARFALYTGKGWRPKNVPVPLRRRGQSQWLGYNVYPDKHDPLRRENWDSPL
jgi:hypothetical protein